MQRHLFLAIVLTSLFCTTLSAQISTAQYSSIPTKRVISRSHQLTLRGEWDRASAELLKKISAAQIRHDRLSESRLRTEYARVLADRNFFHHRDRATADRAVADAQRIAEAVQDRQSLSDLAQTQGQLVYSDAFANGDFKTPRKYFLEALVLRTPLGDLRRLSETHFYLGLTYEQQTRPAEALPHYQQALALAEKSGDKALQSYPHRHIGGLDEEAGRLDSAYQHIQRSLALRREAGFTVGVPYAMLQLADFVAKHRGEHDRAITLTERAIDIAESANSPRAQFAAQLSLAQLELERKHPQASLSYAQCALDGARKFGEPEDVQSAEKQLAEIRSKM